MSKKELELKTLFDSYKCGKVTLLKISEIVKKSYRQIKRRWKSYLKEGDQGLCHKNRGKAPPITHEAVFKEKILALYEEKYLGYGPTYAAEKLEEDDGIKINSETLRLWLKAQGFWIRKRKRMIKRERRERRANFGDLLQIDGSIHKWFVTKDKHYCLLNIVDDATGICFAQLHKGETTEILLQTFKAWVEKYGVPKAVYVDLKSVYVSPKRLKEKYDDDLLIGEGYSVFQQVCKDLNVDIIRAYSEAKGRVERKHGVFQDRLVKDIKLYGLKTIAQVNRYLRDDFLDKINFKFAHLTTEQKDSHRNPSLYGD